jgi:tetratricopeptide (TPR) repeat protein
MRQQMLSEGDEPGLEALLEDIDKIKQRSDPSLHPQLDIIRLRSIATSNDTERIGSALSSVVSEHDLVKNIALALAVVELKREKFGLDKEAIILMENCLKAGFDDGVAEFLIETLIDLGRQAEAEEAFKKYRHRLPPNVSFKLHIDILEGLNDFDSILTELRKYGALYKTYQSHRMYVLLRKGANEEAKNFGKEVLTPVNFSVEAEAEIINYELARKRLGSKVNTERLEKVLQFANDFSTKAAIYALLDNNKEAIEHIKKEMKKDKTFRFTAARWPVFERIRKSPDFLQATSLLTQAPLNPTGNVGSITKISAHA